MRWFPLGLAFTLSLSCGGGEPREPPTSPGPVAWAVTVTPDTATLTAVGAAVQLQAEVFGRGGRPVAHAPVTWVSDEPSVATVDGSGRVAAVGNGMATITAVAGRLVTASAIVTVAQAAVRLDLLPPADTLRNYGDTVRLTVHGADANGHSIPASGFVWSTGDPEVVTVDGAGVVAAIGNGSVHVVAASQALRDSVEVTVLDPVGGARDDRAALVALYDATSSSRGWTNDENWGSADALSTWYGVSTDDDGRVTGLALPGNGLWGPIPDEIGKLTELRTLNLRHNFVWGPILTRVGRLRNLEILDLYATEVGEVQPIPAELGNLSKLRILDLRGTQVRGPLPPELAGLSSLVSFRLEGSRIDGPFPAWLGKLANLEVLEIEDTPMVGPVPPEIGNLIRLRELRLINTGVTDSLPPELGQLASLEVLTISRTRLTGPIPPELGRLEHLRELDLSLNWLTGSIPPELGELNNLTKLSLTWNRLQSQLPPELGRLTKLELLELASIRLSGPIPATLGDLTRLRWLFLYATRLEGEVPPELGNLGELESLYLSGTDLSGPLPSSFTRLTALKHLVMTEAGLCAPRDSAFEAWLVGLEVFKGNRCGTAPP